MIARYLLFFAAIAALAFGISNADNRVQAVDVSHDVSQGLYSDDPFDTSSVGVWQPDADVLLQPQVSENTSLTAIPEPTTLVLGGVCALLSFLYRGRSRG